MLPLFQNLPQMQEQSGEGVGEDEDVASKPKKRRKTIELPSGKLGSVTYVRVYANCRVRRIWFVSAFQ